MKKIKPKMWDDHTWFPLILNFPDEVKWLATKHSTVDSSEVEGTSFIYTRTENIFDITILPRFMRNNLRKFITQ